MCREVPERGKQWILKKHRTSINCAIKIRALLLISDNGFCNRERKTVLQHSAIFLVIFCQSETLWSGLCNTV